MKKILLAALVAGFLGAACAQDITADEMMQLDKLTAELTAKGATVTPAMEARMLQRIRAINALNQGGAPALGLMAPAFGSLNPAQNQPQPVAGAASAVLSEPELKVRLAALEPNRPLGEVKILKDGLMVDGQRFADAEGRASKFATDAATGRVGYVVGGASPEQMTLKIARADKPAEAIPLGQLRRQANGWLFTSVTGKTLSGELFFPLTDGVLLMRDSVGFRYVAGDGVQQINIPAGWYPTPMQRGNVSTTGWLLLEKDTAQAAANPFGVFAKLGKMVGTSESNDYALLQMSTGKMVEIDISSDGKSAYSYSQCRRKNSLVNVCDKMTSYESAFKADGTPNPTHYLWNIDWQRAQSGPILVAAEGMLSSKMTGVDLESGKKVSLYERTLGVTLQGMRVSPQGKLILAVRLGFSGETMDDVANEIRLRPGLVTVASSAKP